jgi:hypothetical protein
MVVGAEPRYFGIRPENECFWTRHIASSRDTSSYGERESENCTVKIKELCRILEKRVEL